MSKCKILVDCLSDYVGQNIYSVLGQNNGRRSHRIKVVFTNFLNLLKDPHLENLILEK